MQKRNMKPTITVGIPAHNEKANIAYVLDSIVRQCQDSYTLERIVVACDGCTDDTAEEAYIVAALYPVIEVINDGKRYGKSQRLNQFFEMNESDILVVFDADVVLADNRVIERLVSHFNDPTIGTVAGNAQPLPGRTLTERIIRTGELLWYEVRKTLHGGNTIYNCGGAVFAIRRQLTQICRYPAGTIADQHFTYFFPQQNGLRFIFDPAAIVWYRVTATLSDFLRQASRSRAEVNFGKAHFSDEMKLAYDNIPLKRKLLAIVITLIRHPITGPLAILLQIALRILPPTDDSLHQQGMWRTVSSSKRIIEPTRKAMLFRLKRLSVRAICAVGAICKIPTNTTNILCYHSFQRSTYRYAISPAEFEEHLEALSQFADFVDLQIALSAPDNLQSPRPKVAITIDDGYRDVLSIAPILERYHIPVTLFVLADPPNANRNELDYDAPLLSDDEIKKLISLGWTIGCHTATHPNVYALDKVALEREITGAKKILEEKFSVPIKYFAYPKGYVTPSAIETVQRAGFSAAFGIEPGVLHPDGPRFNLPRTIIDQTHTAAELRYVINPTSYWLRQHFGRIIWDSLLKHKPI